jgi:Domain of unknown function (DUF4082)
VHRATHAPFRPYRKAALLALSVALASGPVVLVAVSSADAAPTTGALISRAPSRYQVISSGRPLELGLRFSVRTAGWVTGVRVFKGSTAASATPVSGSPRSSSGQRLASAAFKQTTGTGWQSGHLLAPHSGHSRTDLYGLGVHAHGRLCADPLRVPVAQVHEVPIGTPTAQRGLQVHPVFGFSTPVLPDDQLLG